MPINPVDKQSKISFENNKIICSLPITAHTSKIRLKRNGESFATKSKNLLDDDLIEWQISYYKPKTDKELMEIGEMLEFAYKNKIISNNEISELKKYIQSIKKTFFEEYKFRVEKIKNNFYDFEVFLREFPFIRKELPSGCSVEVEIKHQQLAAGFQSMIYIFIPLKIVLSESGNKVVGRVARAKERVLWEPTKRDIIKIIEVFAVASKNHLQDIKDILEKIS